MDNFILAVNLNKSPFSSIFAKENRVEVDRIPAGCRLSAGRLGRPLFLFCLNVALGELQERMEGRSCKKIATERADF